MQFIDAKNLPSDIPVGACYTPKPGVDPQLELLEVRGQEALAAYIAVWL